MMQNNNGSAHTCWLKMALIRHGECGDWRLPDDEFIRTFRLPAERPGILARRNPFPRDDRIVFDAADHSYCVDGIRAPISVTGFLHRFSPDFDPHAAAAAMMGGAGWQEKQHEFMNADGAIKTADEIIDAWARNGEVQRARGTLLHYHAEMALNGYSVEYPHSPEYKQFCRFYADIILNHGWDVYRTEATLFHCGLRMAGQADLLCKDTDGKLIIIDWKRAREIRYANPFRALKEPLEHMGDTNYSLYSLQLNLYAYILETEYGSEVSRMLLGVFHPLSDAARCIEVPRLSEEIALLVEHEIAAGRATQPLPGPHAPFIVI